MSNDRWALVRTFIIPHVIVPLLHTYTPLCNPKSTCVLRRSLRRENELSRFFVRLFGVISNVFLPRCSYVQLFLVSGSALTATLWTRIIVLICFFLPRDFTGYCPQEHQQCIYHGFSCFPSEVGQETLVAIQLLVYPTSALLSHCSLLDYHSIACCQKTSGAWLPYLCLTRISRRFMYVLPGFWVCLAMALVFVCVSPLLGSDCNPQVLIDFLSPTPAGRSFRIGYSCLADRRVAPSFSFWRNMQR